MTDKRLPPMEITNEDRMRADDITFMSPFVSGYPMPARKYIACRERQLLEALTKISELEQQILLIQSNSAINLAAAENRTHAVEERLGVERLRSRMLGVVDGFKAAKSDKEKLREGK